MDMQTNDIISDADIEQITGYKIPSKQCQCLKQAGVFFVVRRDGRPRTTWQHFNDPITHRKAAVPDAFEPNFGALD
ncbi:DUF4224 domain-containing protein [Pantoea phytobeneficialis]|uniref:DUF4224 domain-containing protein n=1 Tax=Pantoea phytobeneficialis TaxID=2052056 RepID=A0AAP9H439_9GAMM|nr:DUF4224 domain-containing protein [Pantoea phytobeneficialis]MDO6406296.1 DUF4224 domain-containing protein [Pantoea phytobeneficialis]QGR06216.1 hypothetical protein CTZ24_07255 [Pantoea phytobeneficialis]